MSSGCPATIVQMRKKKRCAHVVLLLPCVHSNTLNKQQLVAQQVFVRLFCRFHLSGYRLPYLIVVRGVVYAAQEKDSRQLKVEKKNIIMSTRFFDNEYELICIFYFILTVNIQINITENQSKIMQKRTAVSLFVCIFYTYEKLQIYTNKEHFVG